MVRQAKMRGLEKRIRRYLAMAGGVETVDIVARETDNGRSMIVGRSDEDFIGGVVAFNQENHDQPWFETTRIESSNGHVDKALALRLTEAGRQANQTDPYGPDTGEATALATDGGIVRGEQ
jgi:hypothetical protein